MRVFRLSLVAGVVLMLGAIVVAPAMASSDAGSGGDSSLVASGHGKDGGHDAGAGKDGGHDGGYNDDNDNGYNNDDNGHGVGKGHGADVPTTGGGGKDGGHDGGYNDDNDNHDGGVGKGHGADMPTTGGGGLAVASGLSSLMLFAGLMAAFGVVWATGSTILRRS